MNYKVDVNLQGSPNLKGFHFNEGTLDFAKRSAYPDSLIGHNGYLLAFVTHERNLRESINGCAETNKAP